mmetsp:Transcript_35694/g.78175  ORF Transcript_35694/g.78175 Transcript_35694/m.78175 type:complete len:210 (+) Transcript_35694:67-696(+)
MAQAAVTGPSFEASVVQEPPSSPIRASTPQTTCGAFCSQPSSSPTTLSYPRRSCCRTPQPSCWFPNWFAAQAGFSASWYEGTGQSKPLMATRSALQAEWPPDQPEDCLRAGPGSAAKEPLGSRRRVPQAPERRDGHSRMQRASRATAAAFSKCLEAPCGWQTAPPQTALRSPCQAHPSRSREALCGARRGFDARATRAPLRAWPPRVGT